MKKIKMFLTELSQSFIGEQRTIKLKEYMKGFYRYPRNMIGRNISFKPMNLTDILVFSAHPDDEVLGLSATMGRHREKGEKVTVVYITNGTGGDGESWTKRRELSQKIAEIRFKEGIQALSILNIPSENVICLGFPDGGTHRYLKEIAKDIHSLIKKLKPKKIYVHCIEGGHTDHDTVSLVAKFVCSNLNFQSIYEWAEYSSLYPLGTEKMKFITPQKYQNAKEDIIELTDNERLRKKEMLNFHQSQHVDEFYMQGEIIRHADTKHIREEIETNSQVTKEEWSLINKFLKNNRTTSQEHNDNLLMEQLGDHKTSEKT
ncbi:PIG-L deacetylase family protein [Lederbergia panacisoli]|uniref:PIG-L deacetylase family protein n=1 Tax=Lederbergia panacisoli TaxID=1255251 RepID=UPI00214B7BC5|nr:PIG-L family deacetylase [Lederbergia panacisoli]MCR2822012.1 PIG-L family deacetylase [Lederbergia panacisoli]